MDRMIELARHRGSIYRHLASIGVPQSIHCLSLRLAEEYSTSARARSPLPLVDSVCRLSNNSYHHIAILTDNILAASVVVSSTLKSCRQPEKIVFHVVTDKKTYAPMHAWFALNPVDPAVVEVKGLHQRDWRGDVKNEVMEMVEIHSSMREHHYRSDGGSEDYRRLDALRPSSFSLLNHLRMFLPEMFPDLEKIVFLDDDVVVQGDLSPLWGVDLQGKANGAVISMGGDEATNYCIGGRYADYLNFSNPIISDRFEPGTCAWLHGMNVFDLRSWRGAAITQNYVRWLKRNQESGFTLWHLGSLPPALITFHGHIHPINSSWHRSGLGHQRPDVDINTLKAAAVIHFSGPAKPWLEIGSPTLRSLWAAHLNFSSEHIMGCRAEIYTREQREETLVSVSVQCSSSYIYWPWGEDSCNVYSKVLNSNTAALDVHVLTFSKGATLVLDVFTMPSSGSRQLANVNRLQSSLKSVWSAARRSLGLIRSFNRRNEMGSRQISSPMLSPALLLLALLLFPSPPLATAFQVQQWRTLFSLAQSLMHRVANSRASRGDLSGAERARKIAEKLEGGFGFWGGFWSVGWDYVKNYAWRDITSDWPPDDMFRAVSEMNELLGALNEVIRLESDRQRASWVLVNYQKVFRISKSILGRFLVIFSRSSSSNLHLRDNPSGKVGGANLIASFVPLPGPLREMVLILLNEAEGGLLRDCIELGAYDLKGLLQVAKDIALHYMSSPSPGHPSDDL
ncbi:hypothetical protein ACLOJK_010729 [Asimina triloba]